MHDDCKWNDWNANPDFDPCSTIADKTRIIPVFTMNFARVCWSDSVFGDWAKLKRTYVLKEKHQKPKLWWGKRVWRQEGWGVGWKYHLPVVRSTRFAVHDANTGASFLSTKTQISRLSTQSTHRCWENDFAKRLKIQKLMCNLQSIFNAEV